MFAYLYAFSLTYVSSVPVQPGMAQSLTGPPNFVEPNCKSTVNFNNVSWAEGNAEMTVGLLKFKCQGTVRQLHWHPYADEWAYVSKGSLVVTVTGPNDDPWPVSVSRATPGSVWFFPKGWWHIVLCETDECELLLTFNNKNFIGQDDLDFVQAVQTLPEPIAASTLGVSLAEYQTQILPSLQSNDFVDKNALSLSPPGSCDKASQTCSLPGPITTFEPSVETWEERGIARRFASMPNTCKGGEHFGVDVTDMKASNFPFLNAVMSDRSTKRNFDHGMSGQKMVLQPGATRPPVWNTNANAVLYVVEGGPVEVIVYGGPEPGSKKTMYNETLDVGSIVYIPITSMYLVRNPSCDNGNATVTLIFDHPEWEEQEMTKVSLFPRYAVAASLNLNYTPGYV